MPAAKELSHHSQQPTQLDESDLKACGNAARMMNHKPVLASKPGKKTENRDEI